jgi:hypothetical protein
MPESVFLSILYPVSLVELSFQVKSTWSFETTEAFNSVGANGITSTFPSSDFLHPIKT